MHKALHAPNFIWKWLSVLIRRSVYPVIEERLMHIHVQDNDNESSRELTGLESDTSRVFGTI